MYHCRCPEQRETGGWQKKPADGACLEPWQAWSWANHGAYMLNDPIWVLKLLEIAFCEMSCCEF